MENKGSGSAARNAIQKHKILLPGTALQESQLTLKRNSH